MITLLFEFGNEIILVEIKGTDVKFGSTQYGIQLAPIDGLKLDYQGVCREFPDLETHPDWRGAAVKRFKKKIQELKTEEKIADYLVDDLKNFGYKPKSKQVSGFRMEKLT